MPLDWTHTGGGGLGSWPSPVDRASHDPVYGLRPRSTERAFSWRPLGLPSGEDLMASFNKRLEAEGGATKFRLKTDASSALDEVKGVGDGIKSSVGKLFDAGSSRPASDGLMAQDQWKTLVIFFGLTIALSLGSALVSQTGGGEKTSDGAPLEFGSREPYRPQLGQ